MAILKSGDLSGLGISLCVFGKGKKKFADDKSQGWVCRKVCLRGEDDGDEIDGGVEARGGGTVQIGHTRQRCCHGNVPDSAALGLGWHSAAPL